MYPDHRFENKFEIVEIGEGQISITKKKLIESELGLKPISLKNVIFTWLTTSDKSQWRLMIQVRIDKVMSSAGKHISSKVRTFNIDGQPQEIKALHDRITKFY